MTFREAISLQRACGDRRRGLHGSRLSTRGGSRPIETDGRHHACSSFGTSAYDGSTNFDFNNASFKSYANAARQAYADSGCSSNGFERARVHESRYSWQALRRAARLHWRTSE